MLEKLSQVQNLDLEIDALEREKHKAPEELIVLRQQKNDLQAALSSVESSHNSLRKQVNDNDLELKAFEERRHAASAASLSTSNAKEASQYQNQELQLKTRIQEIEEETLPLMEELDTLAEELQGYQDSLAELEPTLEAQVAAEEARLKSLNKKIAAIAKERDAKSRDIDVKLLNQYELIRKTRRGVGIAVIKNRSSCGGCNMKLPMFVVQKAQKGQETVQCPSCNRLLWMSS